MKFHWQISFVADEEAFFAGELSQIFFILGSQRFAGIEDVEDEFGAGEGFAAATDAFGFNFVLCFAQASGVNEHDRDAADVGGFLNRVTRGAGNGHG